MIGSSPLRDEAATVLPAGAIYMCSLDWKRFRLVRCLETVDIAAVDDFLAQPMTVDASGTVSSTGSPSVRVGTKRAVLRPDYLAELRRLQFLAPVDLLIDVYATPVLERWTWRGKARATFTNVTMEGDLVLQIRGHRIKTRFTYPRDVAMRETTDLLEDMGKGVLEPTELGESKPAVVKNWRAEQILFRSGGYSISVRERGPQISQGSFLVPKLDVFFESSATPTVIREIFEGAEFVRSTDYILKRMPSPRPPFLRVNDAIRTSVFGRPATLYTPPRDERFAAAAKVPRIALVYTGPSLETTEYEALSTLLSYLAGGRLRHVSSEAFIPARRLSYRRINRGGGTKRLTPPVPLGVFDGPVVSLVTSQFSTMLDNLHTSLVKNARGTASVFHHYAEARDHTYPTTSVVLMSVAIDAMISLVTGDSQSNATLLAPNTFSLIAPRLLEALDAAFEEEPALAGLESEHARLARKIIDNLNNVSNTKRLQKFWVEYGGIKLTDEELSLLRTRHIALHQGHLGGDERNTATLWENYAKAVRLANLFNRGALAALLKYRGPVLDAADGKSYIRISDGLTYVDMPQEVTPEELRIEFTATVLDTDVVDSETSE